MAEAIHRLRQTAEVLGFDAFGLMALSKALNQAKGIGGRRGGKNKIRKEKEHKNAKETEKIGCKKFGQVIKRRQDRIYCS